ncbi:MAG: hypothetical protein ACHQLA_06645, partial [Ignavibacteriales bacterium]
MTEIRINTFIISLIIILALVSLNTVFSQGVSEEEMEKSFDSALTLYNNGNIEESLADFNKFLNDYNYNAKTTTTEFFIAKIQLQLKQLN